MCPESGVLREFVKKSQGPGCLYVIAIQVDLAIPALNGVLGVGHRYIHIQAGVHHREGKTQ